MTRGWTYRAMLMALVLILASGLVLLGGCGKKAPVETDPTSGGQQDPVTELPPPPASEDQTPVDTTPDYGNLDPADYGIDDVYFAFDQYDLDDEAMGILARSGRILREAGTVVLVSGHCDERGTIEYNLALGEKRANAVRDYLVSLGVPSGNLRVTSYGESKPFARGSNEDAWSLNRRAHFERP